MPSRNALNILKSATVSIVFSQDINSATLSNSTVRINGSLSGLHPATFGYNSPTKTATATPNAPFTVGEVVNVTLTTGIKSAAGSSMAKAYSWSFTARVDGGSGRFPQASPMTAGTNPEIVLSADLDRNGAVDLVVANTNTNALSVMLNNGSGVFARSSMSNAGNNPHALAAGDWNGDGSVDLAVANGSSSSNTIRIMLNNGSGVFTQSSTVSVGSWPAALTAGDWNGDGNLDLAVANAFSNSVSILLNNGSGVFTQNSTVTVGSNPQSIVAADVDGDGSIDLVVENLNSNNISILKNNGSGTFAQTSTVSTAGSPWSVTAADLDGDGAIDLAVPIWQSTGVLIFKNNGSGTFTQTSTVTVGNNPTSIAAADVDGDGAIDLAVANGSSSTVSILKNNGSGTFTQASTVTVGTGPRWITAADLDGDGAIDLATADFDASTISILKNKVSTFPGEYTSDPNTVLLLHMNETSGSSVSDASGNGNNGAATGTTIVDGRFGKTRSFNGTSDYVSVPKNDGFNFGSNPFTVETWVKFSTAPSRMALVAYDEGTTLLYKKWIFWYENGGIKFHVNNPTSGFVDLVSTPWTPIIGKWYHLAVLRNGNTFDLYMDGARIATQTSSVIIPSISATLTIGQAEGLGFLNGLLDEIRISNKARSPQEFNLQLPPKNLSASLAGLAVNLSWQNGGGAVGLLRYKIYRGPDSTNVSLIDSITSLQYSNSGLSAGTRYFYRVSAVDSTGFEGAKSYAAIASVTPLGPVVTTTSATSITATSASLNGLVNPGNVNATALFEYATNSTLTTPSSTSPGQVLATTSAVVYSAGVTGLSTGTTYYYRVVAQNATAKTLGSILSFITIPSPPTLQAPSNGASNVSLSPTLAWNTSTGATTYRLQVSTLNTFSSTVFDDSTITATSKQVSQLTLNVSYYWRVGAKNASGWSSFSPSYSFNTLSPPPSPTIVSPANNASNQPASVTLSWTASTGATSYHLRVSCDASFNDKMIIDDSLITITTRAFSPLAYNTTYYWRIAAISAGGKSPFASASFKTASNADFPGMRVSFPSQPTSSTSYRLISCFGVAMSVSEIASGGTNKVDWRLFRDDGKDLIEITSNNAPLTTGEGFWFLRKGDVSGGTRPSLTMPNLQSDGTVNITLHSGWNIIGNPLDKAVSWNDVLLVNNLPLSLPLYDYAGSYTSSATLEPYKGYYFDNRTAALSALKIRYPFPKTSIHTLDPPAFEWKVRIAFESDINRDEENVVGVASLAKSGMDELDVRKPPLFMDQGFVYFSHPEWDQEYSRFGSDVRPTVGDGQVWDFEVSNPRLSLGKLHFEGIESIPADYEVSLVNASQGQAVNVRESNEYQFKSNKVVTSFKLVIGKNAFVQSEVEKAIPHSFELLQNYPNPFNPSTTITFKLPRDGHVRVEILSLLGQRIKTLVDGSRHAGIHTVEWDGREQHGAMVASGVYFYRLQGDGGSVLTKKLTLIK